MAIALLCSLSETGVFESKQTGAEAINECIPKTYLLIIEP